MTDSPVPQLIDNIVAAAKEHPYFKARLDDDPVFYGRLVFDGPTNTKDPGDFLMIGVEDPDLPDASTSAETNEDFAHTGLDGERDVDGYITCAALSWNGDVDELALKTARDTAYGMTDAIAAMCRGNGEASDGHHNDGTFGVESLLWTSCSTSAALNQGRDAKAALALVVFRIYFRARI